MSFLTDAYKPCHGMVTWFVLLVYIILSILLFFIFALAIWSVVRAISLRRQGHMAIKFFLLFSIPMCLFMLTSVGIYGRFVMWVEACEFDVSDDSGFVSIAFFTLLTVGYINGLAAMYFSFSTRLLSTFDRSAFQVKRCTKKYLQSVSYVQSGLCLLLCLFLGLFGIGVASMFGAIILLSYIFHSVAVMVIFRSKLRSVSSLVSEFTNDDSIDSALVDAKNLATRLLVCVFFALVSTFLVTMNSVIGALGPDNHYDSVMGMILIMCDVLTNSLCLTMQWSFGNVVYTKMCNKCHTFMSTERKRETRLKMSTASVSSVGTGTKSETTAHRNSSTIGNLTIKNDKSVTANETSQQETTTTAETAGNGARGASGNKKEMHLSVGTGGTASDVSDSGGGVEVSNISNLSIIGADESVGCAEISNVPGPGNISDPEGPAASAAEQIVHKQNEEMRASGTDAESGQETQETGQ